MKTHNHHTATPRSIAARSPRTDFPTADEDSPYSPYLRRWFAQQAARHRDLLLNIDAATRIGLAPVLVGR